MGNLLIQLAYCSSVFPKPCFMRWVERERDSENLQLVASRKWALQRNGLFSSLNSALPFVTGNCSDLLGELLSVTWRNSVWDAFSELTPYLWTSLNSILVDKWPSGQTGLNHLFKIFLFLFLGGHLKCFWGAGCSVLNWFLELQTSNRTKPKESWKNNIWNGSMPNSSCSPLEKNQSWRNPRLPYITSQTANGEAS